MATEFFLATARRPTHRPGRPHVHASARTDDFVAFTLARKPDPETGRRRHAEVRRLPAASTPRPAPAIQDGAGVRSRRRAAPSNTTDPRLPVEDDTGTAVADATTGSRRQRERLDEDGRRSRPADYLADALAERFRPGPRDLHARLELAADERPRRRPTAVRPTVVSAPSRPRLALDSDRDRGARPRRDSPRVRRRRGSTDGDRAHATTRRPRPGPRAQRTSVSRCTRGRSDRRAAPAGA